MAEASKKEVTWLRKAWNFVRGRDLLENADGTITNKFGQDIIPYRVTVGNSGSVSANPGEHMFQPRVNELKEQMKPFLTAARGDLITLDAATGEFFMQSDLEKSGRAGVKVLGTVDLPLEQSLFDAAHQRISMQKLFGDASPQNPIVVTDDGTVYPANDPAQIRGKVSLGPAVAGPAARRKLNP
jgi:hypothetical protein